MFRKPNRTSPYSFGENDWTDINWEKGVSDYFLSKTVAEKAAWEFMESKGLKDKLTVINPGGVFGDALDSKECTSIEYVKQFLKGKFPAAPKWGVLISHVEDVAKFIQNSIEQKIYSGVYNLATENNITELEFINILRKIGYKFK